MFNVLSHVVTALFRPSLTHVTTTLTSIGTTLIQIYCARALNLGRLRTAEQDAHSKLTIELVATPVRFLNATLGLAVLVGLIAVTKHIPLFVFDVIDLTQLTMSGAALVATMFFFDTIHLLCLKWYIAKLHYERTIRTGARLTELELSTRIRALEEGLLVSEAGDAQ